jgi:hypothetical protein
MVTNDQKRLDQVGDRARVDRRVDAPSKPTAAKLCRAAEMIRALLSSSALIGGSVALVPVKGLPSAVRQHPSRSISFGIALINRSGAF